MNHRFPFNHIMLGSCSSFQILIERAFPRCAVNSSKGTRYSVCFRLLGLASVALLLSVPNVAIGSAGNPTRSSLTVVGYVPITITNSQKSGTGTYQQTLTVNSSKYSSYINSAWSNVLFQYQTGTNISAWIDSGNSNKTTHTVVILKLGSIPAMSSLTINMVFLPRSTNVLSSKGPTGEAPWLTKKSWGKYDDGPLVFDLYANFQKGTSLPSGWSLQGTAGLLDLGQGKSSVALTNNQNNEEGAIVYAKSFNMKNIVVEMSGAYNGRADDIGIGFYSSGPTTNNGGWNPRPNTGYYASYEFWSGDSSSRPALLDNGSIIAEDPIQSMPSGFLDYIFAKVTVRSSSITMGFLNNSVSLYQDVPKPTPTTAVLYNAAKTSIVGSKFYLGGSTGGAAAFTYVFWIRVVTFEAHMPTASFSTVM
jgi:hypothetical protein